MMSPVGILEDFAQLPDPQAERARLHKLLDIVANKMQLLCHSPIWTGGLPLLGDILGRQLTKEDVDNEQS